MSDLPKFNVGSKPKITGEQFDAAAEAARDKFISEPGTYDLLIKSAEWKNPSEKDPVWVTLQIELENTEGKTMRHFIMVPTECQNDFLFGADKKAFAFEQLAKFVRGLGITLSFENAMEQVASIFGDLDKLIGKSIKVSVTYEGSHLKYLGKDADGNKKYQIVDKKGEPRDEIFADRQAAEAFAKANKIPLVFLKIKDIFAAKQPALTLAATGTDTVEYPF